MRIQKQLALALFGAGLVGTTTAQNAVGGLDGPAPNIPTPAIDFDTPLIPSGPPPAGLFTGTGITSVTVIGTGWVAAGDVLSAPSNVNGQGFVVQNGAAAIAGVNEPLDQPAAGDGFDIVLDNLVDEAQVKFIDQVGFTYYLELFDGATLIGGGTQIYGAGCIPGRG